MTSVCEPGGRSQRTNSFEADTEGKTIRCDRKKYVRRRVWFTRECFPGSQKVLVGKKIARKEMPLTINKCRWQWTRAREVLTHLSTAYFTDFPKHRGVHAETYVEYVQRTCSVRAKWERGYGPRPPGGRFIIDERTDCSWYIIENYSKIQKQLFL